MNAPAPAIVAVEDQIACPMCHAIYPAPPGNTTRALLEGRRASSEDGRFTAIAGFGAIICGACGNWFWPRNIVQIEVERLRQKRVPVYALAARRA